jgi:Flp pilus assembly pilin Flp
MSLRHSATNMLRDGMEAMKAESGQDILEYAVIAGAVAIVAGAALIFGQTWLGDALDSFKTQVGDCISFQSTCGGG